MLGERLQRIFQVSQISPGCVPYYLKEAKILNCDPLDPKLKVNFLKSLYDANPTCVHPGYSYSHPIMIRSLISQDIKR